MTEIVTELDKSEAEIAENSTSSRGAYIVAGNEGSPVPKLHRGKANKNDVETMTPASESTKESVGKQSSTEGRLQPTHDNYQEQSSNGSEKNAGQLLADELDKQTNSVDHSLP